MGADGQHLLAPVGVQAQQGADPEAAHARLGAPVGRGQAPVVVALLALQVGRLVGAPVVGLLVDDQPFAAGLDQPAVGGDVPHLHLDRQRRHDRRQRPHAVDQVVLGHDPGVLPGHQQHVAEAAGGQGGPSATTSSTESVRRAMSLPAEKPQ